MITFAASDLDPKRFTIRTVQGAFGKDDRLEDYFDGQHPLEQAILGKQKSVA